MAFDGITVAALVQELNTCLTEGRLQKIAQPEPDELLLTIKKNRENYKLQISASASLPLLHLTENAKPSPLTAPNFCMLLRKHLNGARILGIEQMGLERVIAIHMENLNELGDVVHRRLMVEIMGKHSNIIFVDDNNLIVDSIKHVNGMVSSVREVLPGREYFIPNTRNKQNPFELTIADWNGELFTKPVSVAKALYGSLTGFSAVMAQELAYRSRLDGDAPMASLNGNEKSALMSSYRQLMEAVSAGEFHPCIIFDGPVPMEFAAVPLTMYEDKTCREYTSMSQVVETFYGEKDVVSRIRQKSADLRKNVTTLLERCQKKSQLQRKQLADTEKKEKFRVYGELIHTYGYQLSPEDTTLTCMNYYDNQEITIPVDSSMTPAENANKYFNKYNKMKRTYQAVSEQLKENEETIAHLESILTELDIARKEEDLQYIRQELSDCGYMKKPSGTKKNGRMPKSAPLHFVSSDGYDMYVGKNNYQNEELTFKMASGSDWWFHAKNMPGSHVIVKCHGEEPPIRTFEEAASLAAYFSKGKGSEKLEIDYTQKKNVKKPNGSKPGFVVYYTNYSLMASSHIEHIQCVGEGDAVFLERSYL
ncbi:MAG: NFACT family protein [Lachnospiraceae bacterium]|nr:NFACT family protein [Lachnospiraceae bacterium]